MFYLVSGGPEAFEFALPRLRDRNVDRLVG